MNLRVASMAILILALLFTLAYIGGQILESAVSNSDFTSELQSR